MFNNCKIFVKLAYYTQSRIRISHRESKSNLTVCEGYQDLRGDADLGNEGELVKFFNSVMERRELNEWN